MKTTQTFSVQFIARIKKSNLEQAFIYARITVCGKAIEISLKHSINYVGWDRKGGCLNGNAENSKKINKHIEHCRFRLMECYQQLLLEHQVITADKIKSLFLGETKSENTLTGLITYYNNNMENVLSAGTLKNYYTTEKYVKKFLKYNYKCNDIFLSSLNYQFITEFEFYLRTCEPLEINNPLTNNGIMKYMERFRKMVTMSYKMEWIPKDPFSNYKLKFHRKEMSFLSKDELFKIEHTVIKNKLLDKVRNLFIFSCYTGLSYIDLANLKPNNVNIGIDGEYWIQTSRKKTEVQVNIPLLPKALQLIEKYRECPLALSGEKVLPVISNQKINSNLKAVAVLCSLNKLLTFHCARHTFATTVTLTNGVPLETVSKMLGHTKLSTTQIYVHVLKHKISDDMKLLKQKLYKQKEKNDLLISENFGNK